MNEMVTTKTGKEVSLIATMAHGYGMEAKAFAETVRKTCMPATASNEDFAAFLLVAHQHGLNPVTREIYAFPKKGGGIQPIVGIDGWMTLINSHPNFDGMEFDDQFDDKGKLIAIQCSIFRKDRSRPIVVTEYMDECQRPTEPWQKWPARMLRHKAAIQCARYAFGFAGIIDQDEAERSPEVITGNVVAPPPPQVEHQPEPDAIDVEANPPFDPDAFLTNLYADMEVAQSEEVLMETWDGYDVERRLADHEDKLQDAFDMRKQRQEALAAA